MNSAFKEYLLDITQASNCKEIEVIQSLWSGYGKIVRIQLEDSNISTVVVKNIEPKYNDKHPRGWNTDASHLRKIKSYQIEQNWYEKWNQKCRADVAVPKFMGSFIEGESKWIVLEDLDAKFPLRKEHLEYSEVQVCLKWLANFHGLFLNQKPKDLWDIGTYWHLETRPDEFKKLAHVELKAKAHVIDELLNKCKYKTIVHGDAKLANFCFSENGKHVAALDFQYVGGGCGIKDVAYFLGSCLSSSECELYETELLSFYFKMLKEATLDLEIDFRALEKEWRTMYPIACADFTRFLMGWMPTHQKINPYNLKILNTVLASI